MKQRLNRQENEKLRMDTKHQNLFISIGKYVHRQKENTLTQGRADIYNNSIAFRNSFEETLESKFRIK
jgi:hypothetical protein